MAEHSHPCGLTVDDDASAAVADDLDGMRWAGGARWLVAEVPQMGSDEDEEQDQRDHHVVVDVAAGVGPVEIAFQDACSFAAPGGVDVAR